MALEPVQVGLLWHSASSGNLGVGALTVSNISIIRDVAHTLGLEPKFTIIGMFDPGESYLDDPSVEVYSINSRSLLSRSGCWRKIGSLDFVVDIGAGDSFAEIYGPKRYGFLWLTKVMAIARKKPLLLSPQTIGPFTRAPYKALSRFVLERAVAVVARDRQSLDFVRLIAPRARSVLSTDVAFALPYATARRESSTGRTRVGINVSGLLLCDAEAGRNRFNLGYDYAVLTRKLLETLVARPELEVNLFAHATSTGDKSDDDNVACDRLAAEFGSAIRVPNFRGPSDAKSYISGLDFVVAGRMHACIGAMSAGVPVVPVAYSRKFAGLFGTLGYSSFVPAQGMGTEDALSYILDKLERRDVVRADVARSLENVSGLLNAYRAELKCLLGGDGN